MNRGLFITVEGIEGAGKTTNLEFIRSVLQEQGMEVVTTREPGGTPMAEEIREMLLKPREEKVSAKAELLMMFAARAQHLEQKVLPLLKAGTHVLSDRFTDATYAYQGGGRGLSWDLIKRLEVIVQEEFRPDLTLLLCVNPEVGIARARKRGALDRFEQEKLEFYTRVQDAYMKRVSESPERFCVVNAQEPLEVIQPQIRQALLAKLVR